MPLQRIRDPLHNLIEFDVANKELEMVLWEALQTRPFQRLRRVKQLGFSELVYPGASHSRFAHSIGVFHTARRLMKIIQRDVHPPADSKVHQALAAALLHDLGHGPFSHAFEPVGKELDLPMADHEHVSDLLIRDGEIAEVLKKLGTGFAADVADIITGRGENNIYRAVVSSQFDADRLDYMRRDRLMTGTQHSVIDFEWLMANIEVGTVSMGVDDERVADVETFVLGSKALYAAEGYVLGLFQLYPTVYLHKATRGAEKLFGELIKRLVRLVQDGSAASTGLDKNHPLVQFAEAPDQVEQLLALDDAVVWGALTPIAQSHDKPLADLAHRLRDRQLYKCVDVRAHIDREAEFPMPPDEVDMRCEKIKDSLAEWIIPAGDGLPRVLVDEAERSPYRRVTESKKGPLDQINIMSDGGRLIDLSKRSKVVGELETFKALRFYYAPEDSESKKAIEDAIAEGVQA